MGISTICWGLVILNVVGVHSATYIYWFWCSPKVFFTMVPHSSNLYRLLNNESHKSTMYPLALASFNPNRRWLQYVFVCHVLYILYTVLFGNVERSMYLHQTGTCVRSDCVHVCGTQVWLDRSSLPPILGPFGLSHDVDTILLPSLDSTKNMS